jgi:methylmalonyl-CoA mutase cobalamin-binding subunit
MEPMMPSDRGFVLPPEMPSGRDLIIEGHAVARTFEVGRSLQAREFGVDSEAEYKQKMLAEGRIMTCMNIGAATWAETEAGLRYIWEESAKKNFRIDRFTFQLDRRMGVPQDCWGRAAKETGPLLVTDEDWHGPANTVPIQPGMGDMMIGSPMSVLNAVRALRSGVYYVGNMSQFSWKYPVWDGSDVDQMAEMVKALAIMGAKKDSGAVVQSYLDDGYCAQFSDYASFVGWALFERYIVEDLFGGALSVTWGGLTHNPIIKSAVTMALEAVKPLGRFNAFYHCDTTHFVPDIQRNYPALSLDMLFLVMTEMRIRAGACVLPIPVTEALRIPSFDEIIEVHNITRKIVEDAPRISETIDWEKIERVRDRLVAAGRQFYANILAGLEAIKIDIRDPLQVLLAVRRLGAVEIERRWGVGSRAGEDLRDYAPIVPTDTHTDYVERSERIANRIRSRGEAILRPMRVVVGSTDVHEFGMHLVAKTLESLGLKPEIAGVNVDPDEFAELAASGGTAAVLISTHNGMALTYAKQLLRELGERATRPKIIMGGVLNQDYEGKDLPIDVRDDLRRLGIIVCDDVDQIYAALQSVA